MKFEDVFQEELAELDKRRALRGDDAGAGASASADPSGLVGLCFSGGGIRSATFNLGIARGLHRWGMLRTVDYLSTVSGGGYIGSCLANYFRLGTHEQLLADREQGTVEPPGLTRLRGYGRYLTPTGGLGEWLQALTSIARGVLWNIAFLLVVGAALAAACSFGLDRSGQWIFPFPHGLASGVCVGVAVVMMMASVFGSRLLPARLLVGMVMLTVVVVAMDLLPSAFALVAGESAAIELAVLGSALAGLIGSGTLSKLPAKLVVLLARLFAFLLALVVPLGLFLVLLVRFVIGSPTVLIEQGVAIGLFVVFGFVDFNRTSIHGFYRDRLGMAYLGPEPPKLSAFVGKPGPLHLVNVALNVPSDADPALRDRRADFFTISCLHVGGPRVGYAATARHEQAKTDFTLASAVAISGAAAAPNMGSFTDSLIRPIMTVLNIRMGYWTPHPRALAEGKSGWMPRLPYLYREMTGDLTTETKLVNISDGGHLENLGAFELLRRKCKLIIIGDGGAGSTFDALAALIRFARIDLNTEIEIDVDDLRTGANGLSCKHAAVGTVRYDDGSIGRILYLKSSLTGREPPDVRYYKDTHPEFPSESTADQWFDDAQFDAYLSLGEEVVDSLFQDLGFSEPEQLAQEGSSWEQRVAALNVILAPSSRSRSAQLMEHFNRVQEALMHDEFADYRSQLVPTQFTKAIPTDKLHTLVPVIMLQLQLMEHAVDELGLVDARNREALANRGWMNVFRLWSRSDAFQRVALVCVPSFGAQLAQFMDVGLNLGIEYTWSEHPDAKAFPNVLLLGETNPEVAADQPNRRFVTGLAEYAREGEDIVVSRLALRVGFEGRDRLEAAVAALREKFRGSTVRLTGQAGALVKRLPGDSYIHSPVRSQWAQTDEQTILDLSRKTFEREQRGDEELDAAAAMQAMSFDLPKR